MNLHETLDEREVISTIQKLRARVAERFPTRGLTKTATDLLGLARVTASEAAKLRHPNWLLRSVTVFTFAAGIAGFFFLLHLYDISLGGEISLDAFTQGLEAALNILLICAIIIAAFLRLENLQKRRKALEGLHRLRVISHVIDMHQLTKDPQAILTAPRTESSPLRDLTEEQLLRYLDYCTEMLSLTGKLAALYAQYFPDATVVGAVNDVESLTTNLSRKMWQKIMIIKDERHD